MSTLNRPLASDDSISQPDTAPGCIGSIGWVDCQAKSNTDKLNAKCHKESKISDKEEAKWLRRGAKLAMERQ